MIDNFELIKSLFYFNEANDMFFHLQIVQRAKDHKGENKKVKERVQSKLTSLKVGNILIE